MHNKHIQCIKATIITIIVAFIFAGIVCLIMQIAFGQTIWGAISLMNRISLDVSGKQEIETVYNPDKKRLENYPEYGTKYATIQIESINVDLPVYFGDTLEILKYGIGHSAGSYFPGEGGSIVYMGHNNVRTFRRLGEVKQGDIIKVITSYGEYNYEVYDTKIIGKTEKDKLPIQKEREILMVYTCYPFTSYGNAPSRCVVYAERVD